MTRRLLTGLLGAALIALALASGASASGTRLAPAGGPPFPSRSYVLTLPEGVEPTTDAISVTENGTPVTDVTIRSANGSRRGLGVVLVIDASRSMHGAAITGAMRAARAFAARRPATQPLGIVSFNDTPVVLTKPTTDHAAIDAALHRPPPLGHGTHIYDATSAAVRLLAGEHRDAGAIVLLSDGSDSGSVATPAAIAAAARAAKVQIFSVGVRSRVFDQSTLRDVARGSGGYLGAVSAPALARLYEELGGRLANAYVVRYRSTSPAGTRVAVVAAAGGESARFSYTAPTPVSLRARVTRSSPPLSTPFLGSTNGAVLVSLAVLVLIFGALAGPLGHLGRRRRIRSRVSSYGVEGGGEDLSARIQEYELARAAGSASGRMARIAEMLELGGVELGAMQVVLLTIVLDVLVAWVVLALTGLMVFMLIVGVMVPFAVRALVRMRVRRRRHLFSEQLPDSLQATAAAMRTGHSFAGAIAQLVQDAGEPSATEFARVIADERLGVPLEEAFASMSARMDNRDIEQVALVAVLQRETGGNGAEALDRVVENLRARDEVQRLVTTLTAQGRLSRWVLTGIPVVLGVTLTLANPEYMAPLYETAPGRFALVVAVVLVTVGSLIMKRIVDNVKV